MLPVQSPTLLLIGHGAVNVTFPKPSTVPATVPSRLETAPLLIIRNSDRLRLSVTPPGPGFLKKKSYVPSNFPDGDAPDGDVGEEVLPPHAVTNSVVTRIDNTCRTLTSLRFREPLQKAP